MSIILYAGKWLDVFTQPEDQAKLDPDNAGIMSDSDPLNSSGIAFAAQHIGRVARAYRMHPYHHTV